MSLDPLSCNFSLNSSALFSCSKLPRLKVRGRQSNESALVELIFWRFFSWFLLHFLVDPIGSHNLFSDFFHFWLFGLIRQIDLALCTHFSPHVILLFFDQLAWTTKWSSQITQRIQKIVICFAARFLINLVTWKKHESNEYPFPELQNPLFIHLSEESRSLATNRS